MSDGASKPVLRYVLFGGAASIATLHFNALAKLPAQVAGLSDIDGERGAARAAEVGCPFYLDHRQMLADLQPDIAVICTPHPSHAALAIDCFAAGVHVLVEKPIAVEVADADAMIAAAKRANRLLAVNFQHRFDPVVERAKQLIEAGEVGPLVRVLCLEPWLRTAAYYRSNSWRGTWEGEGGGVLMNQSSHTLDILCYLVGQPLKVWGWVRTRYHQIACEDSAQAMLEYPNGAPGYFTASTAEAGGQRRVQIVGERASLELVGEQLIVQRFSPPLREHIANNPDYFSSPNLTTEQFDLLIGDTGNHLAVHRDLQAALAEGRQPRCNGREGLFSLELANAITYSSYTGAAVNLPLDRGAYHALLADLKSGAR